MGGDHWSLLAAWLGRMLMMPTCTKSALTITLTEDLQSTFDGQSCGTLLALHQVSPARPKQDSSAVKDRQLWSGARRDHVDGPDELGLCGTFFACLPRHFADWPGYVLSLGHTGVSCHWSSYMKHV